VPGGCGYDQGGYRVRFLFGRQIGFAEHLPGALEVGSPVDTMTRKAADDSFFEAADWPDVILGLQDRALAGDPGERVHDRRAIAPYLSQDRAGDDGPVRGCRERLVGDSSTDVLVQQGDEHAGVVIDETFTGPRVRVICEQVTRGHGQATLPDPAVSATISASMVVNDAAA